MVKSGHKKVRVINYGAQGLKIAFKKDNPTNPKASKQLSKRTLIQSSEFLTAFKK